MVTTFRCAYPMDVCRPPARAHEAEVEAPTKVNSCCYTISTRASIKRFRSPPRNVTPVRLVFELPFPSMSLSSTSTVKSQLTTALGQRATLYFNVLKEYLSGRISRNEYDDQVKALLDSTHLCESSLLSATGTRPHGYIVQLHNALIVSLFDTSAHLAPLAAPPPDVPRPPPRKRRRTLPYQGPDPHEMTTLRSERLKKWTVGIGRRERDRIRALEAVATNETPHPKAYTDEIVAERGVQLLSERGGAPVLTAVVEQR